MTKLAKLPQVGDKVWAFSPNHRQEIKVQVKKVFANSFQGLDSEKNTITKLSKWRPIDSTPENGTVEPNPAKALSATITNLPLDQIKVERRFQQRSDLYNLFDDKGEPYLDPSIVERYQELLLKEDDGSPKDPPPLIVHRLPDGNFYLVDGFHRYAALQADGRTTAPCEIIESTEPDALLQSCTINLKNGLGVRKADISRSIWRIFSVLDSLPDGDSRKKWSDRHISRLLGCSNSTVSIVHNQFLNKKAFEEQNFQPGDRIKCIDPNSKYNGFVGQITRLDLSQGVIVIFDKGQTTDVFIFLPPESLVKTQEVFVEPNTDHQSPAPPGQQSTDNSQPSGVSHQSSVTTQQTGEHLSSSNKASEVTAELTLEPLLTEKQLETASNDQLSDLFRKISLKLKQCLDPGVSDQLDDLVEKYWGEIGNLEQRDKERFLILLIDKSFNNNL
ncbi:hypothetical protein PL8927_510015 [Planktothrix serta PCC 8927]|uniref:ParB/Sulfiredoxin domain-containing protein n=1 Tax=Planktothrix serta PCC 8927 TaxID=671068 RepID=A0A7Z9BS20_9CYAN|nr:ParB N-terminal domain-containing protein [Planktothrix serta]VXD15987.1 hypothetical protein PL8927_510015 [Planktothrix serta PCC 8927]